MWRFFRPKQRKNVIFWIRTYLILALRGNPRQSPFPSWVTGPEVLLHIWAVTLLLWRSNTNIWIDPKKSIIVRTDCFGHVMHVIWCTKKRKIYYTPEWDLNKKSMLFAFSHFNNFCVTRCFYIQAIKLLRPDFIRTITQHKPPAFQKLSSKLGNQPGNSFYSRSKLGNQFHRSRQKCFFFLCSESC